jgi:hypothetical protein
MGWFEHAPLWLVWPALSLALLLAMAAGCFARRVAQRRPGARELSDSQGFLLSAALALLGLLIAFTFSMASARFDARRGAMLDEANAVGTTYLRFQLPDEPYRSTLSNELLSYLDARQAFFAAGGDLSAVDRADTATGQVENRMWPTLTDWIQRHSGDAANVSLLQATNDMFDLAATDRVVRETRVPLTIIRAIAIYSLIAAFLLGQSFAAKKDNQPFAAGIVFILVALSISLILDLDRPASGTITVSTVPFERAVAAIRATEATRPAKQP